jgi:hypothetical protein
MSKRERIVPASAEMDAELRAILDTGGPARMQKGDITLEMAMAHYGLGRAQTRVRLVDLEDKGKLTKSLVVLDGKVRAVWRKAEKAADKGRKATA